MSFSKYSRILPQLEEVPFSPSLFFLRKQRRWLPSNSPLGSRGDLKESIHVPSLMEKKEKKVPWVPDDRGILSQSWVAASATSFMWEKDLCVIKSF